MIWAVPIAGATPLDKAIDRALADPALDGASAGVAVYEADGSPRLALDAGRRLVPASTSKWVTAAAAARDLGLEHRFHTGIGARGYTEGTELVGDVVIVGGGDPSLGDPDPTAVVRQVVDVVLAGGITRVRGSVVVDASTTAGPPLGPGWMWDDLNAPYSPPYGALNIGHNLLREGWTCEARAGVGSPLVDPPACFASEVTRALIAAGVAVDGPPTVGPAPDGVVLVDLPSPPLRELLRHTLGASDNLYAECLRSALDTVSPREPGVADARIAALLADAGVPADQVRLVDGSGLSRYSLLSADALARVSAWVVRQPWGPELVELLPVAGRDGTLATRLVGTPVDGTLRAKTGSMSGVRNLVGYVPNADGEPLVFAVLFNGFVSPQAQAIAVQDRVILLIAASDRRGRVPRRTVAALAAAGG